MQARELSHASRQVTAIEINGTFYGSQKPASFRRWHDETPDDFVFSLKGPRFVTHRRDLASAGPSIERFFASGVLELAGKLGPILWQFAPFLRFDEAAFAAFLALLPRQIEGRALRHVVEVRHPSFATAAFADLLRRHGVAVALVDDEKYPALEDITADFVYAAPAPLFAATSRPAIRRTRSMPGPRAPATGAPPAAMFLSISSTAPKSARRPRHRR